MKQLSAELEYFNTVIRNYLVGDLEYLLTCENMKAGPVLIISMNGIDILGGVLYGFEKGTSGKRSVQFMTDKMGLEAPVASLLYNYVRCGIAHEGITKSVTNPPRAGISFGIPPKSLEQDDIFFKDSDCIGIDVRRFAQKVIAVIKTINDAEIEHIPEEPKLEKFIAARDVLAAKPLSEFLALFNDQTSSGRNAPDISPIPSGITDPRINYKGISGYNPDET